MARLITDVTRLATRGLSCQARRAVAMQASGGRGGLIDLALLNAAVLLTRIIFRSRYLYDIDSVNFALALHRFDPLAHQPHPPGYFLYICLGRAVNLVAHDANLAFVAISVTASCGAMSAMYVLARNWWNRSAAFFTGLIFVFSPLVWFHGTVALTYTVELFFSSVTGYLCWRVFEGSRSLVIPAAIAAGLAAGFRPSFLLFIGPLLVFSWFFSPGRARAPAGLIALSLTFAAWFIPMVRQSGGFNAWWSALLSLWRNAPARQTSLNSFAAISLARALTVAGICVLCFGTAALLIFRGARRNPPVDRRKTLFTWIWIGPGLLFFTLIFLRFVNSGYLLVISPPIFAWMGLRLSKWYEEVGLEATARVAVIAACAATNVFVFLYAPIYCSWASVRHFEADLELVVSSLPRIASPTDTMIVGLDSHFLGYRHAGYYLPDWYVAQYPEVRLSSGTRVFAMENRDTRLVGKLPAAGFRNFIIFPLPTNDPDYAKYMTALSARFPNGAIRRVTAGGREVLEGSTADLGFLFPSAANTGFTADHAVADR